jgi:prepilin-type N-terminal cleavage/methylation domain-containing protein
MSLRPGRRHAFTLIELLVVITIIAILTTMGLPMIRNMNKSNGMTAADRQLLDDISYARQRAISDHTTVYMVFVPPGIINFTLPSPADAVLLNQYTNLYGGQFTTYALLSLRAVGEQPGRSTPHYLTAWRSLPNGVFIATNKYNTFVPLAPGPVRSFPVTNIFPFPMISTNALPVVSLPFIGFDYLGRLVTSTDEYIPLARGSIFYARDANGAFAPQPASVQESPPGNSISISNVIHIDWLTGRAKVEREEVH